MRRPLPPLNSLRTFEAAARLSSFSRAADELCLTPSAVGQSVRALERWLGARLFVRDSASRSLALTAVGRAYLATAIPERSNQTNRRSFLATSCAAAVSPFLPKPAMSAEAASASVTPGVLARLGE